MLARQDQLKRQRCQGARAGGRFSGILRTRHSRGGAKNDDHDRNTEIFVHDGYLRGFLVTLETVRLDLEPLARSVFCQTRNPPTNALALSPALQPAGNFFRLLTFPPPKTTSSGSSAAIRRAITSLTACSHFFCPRRLRPATPT